MKDDPDVLESCAWGLIYAIGVLPFADVRPRGSSEIDFQDKDEWTVADMLRHLTFVRGRLHFHADYVRGRMLKTTVEIDKDGKILLETINRGETADPLGRRSSWPWSATDRPSRGHPDAARHSPPWPVSGSVLLRGGRAARCISMMQ